MRPPSSHAQEGDRARDEGRDADAIIAYEEAVRASPEPKNFYNLAAACQKVGRYAEALTWFLRFKEKASPDEREKPVDAKPFWSQWWFWTGAGVLVAGGAATAYALSTEKAPGEGSIGRVVGPLGTRLDGLGLRFERAHQVAPGAAWRRPYGVAGSRPCTGEGEGTMGVNAPGGAA
ncbi:MAG TPA: hypothetical protein VFS43_34540 [Polyangiaceae bacterium]|nr:hypothetical protein [Polyangiaceae bacterium]